MSHDAWLMILFLFYLNELYSCLSNLDDTSRRPVIYDFRASTCILRPRSWKCMSMHLRTRRAYSQRASIRLLSSKPPSPLFFWPIIFNFDSLLLCPLSPRYLCAADIFHVTAENLFITIKVRRRRKFGSSQCWKTKRAT